MDKQIIIGIDPGYAITGYGIIEKCGNKLRVIDYGVVSTKATMPFPERLLAINSKIRYLLEFYKPDLMAVEELFLGQNKTTAIGTAQARGVVIVEAFVYVANPLRIIYELSGNNHILCIVVLGIVLNMFVQRRLNQFVTQKCRNTTIQHPINESILLKWNGGMNIFKL